MATLFSIKLRLIGTGTDLSDGFVSSSYFSSRVYFEKEIPAIELESLEDFYVSESLAHILAQHPKLYKYLEFGNIELQFLIGFHNRTANYYIECYSDWLNYP